MTSKRCLALAVAAVSLATCLAGCGGRDIADLDVARARIDPLVFDEDYGDDVYFQAYSSTYYDAVSIDSVYAYNGAKSLKVVVPGQGWALGDYAGGVLTCAAKRDEADFNALTFYVRSSVSSTLNEVGFGDDNTGTSPYKATRSGIPVTSDWTFVVVPIPCPSKLIAERGLFLISEGYEDAHPEGYELWFDDIRFAKLTNIKNPRPRMTSSNKQYFTGSTVSLEGTRTVFEVDTGVNVVVDHLPGYFDFVSSSPDVAVVDGGRVRVVGVGNAVVRATMPSPDGDVLNVAGALTVSGYPPPTSPAPAPSLPAADVIAMYSDVYRTWTVDSWNPHWNYSTAEDAVYTVAGDHCLMYANLNFVGIVFTSHTVDASTMTHLHLDVYAPAGADFKVKVVGFNADNGTMTGQAELTFDASTTPAFTAGGWSSLEIPLASFALSGGWNHIGQLVLSTTDARLVLVDNVYWHK